MAYTSEHAALAAMELLGYWNSYPNMQGYKLFSADIDTADIETAPSTINIQDQAQTRAFGDLWVSEQRTFALQVPSVVMPLSFNFLLNPDHPRMATFTYVDEGDFEFDSRVTQLINAAHTAPDKP